MKSLLEQNGGVTILLTMAILTSIIIVSISVITLRINRLRFTSNIATATKTLQEAKNLREEIFFHVLKCFFIGPTIRMNTRINNQTYTSL